MNKQKDKTAVTKNEAAAKKGNGDATITPMFVEAEKMFEEFAEITKETTQKAFEYFLRRGGEFGREVDDWFNAQSEILRPVPVEMTDRKGNLHVNAVVAGFKPEEIEINVKDNLLTIRGKTEMHTAREDENLVYTDFSSNRFFRQIPLPRVVDADRVEAHLRDGILEIDLPVAKPHEAKQIAVSAG